MTLLDQEVLQDLPFLSSAQIVHGVGSIRLLHRALESLVLAEASRPLAAESTYRGSGGSTGDSAARLEENRKAKELTESSLVMGGGG